MVFHVRGSNANRKRSTSATAIILSSCILPVYAKWFTNHRRENPAVQITDESIGPSRAFANCLQTASISGPRIAIVGADDIIE